jgi:hypothetical protein
MEKKTKIILGLTVAAGVGYLIYKKLKSKTNVGFVNATGSVAGADEVQFILTNNTPQPQTVTLFDASGGQMNNSVSISSPVLPSVEFFNKSLTQEPKALNYMYINSNNKGQTTKVITKKCRDANGNVTQSVLTPTISPMQAQSNVVTINTSGVILDGKCFFEYQLEPNSSVTWTLNYSTHKNASGCNACQAKAADGIIQNDGLMPQFGKPINIKL